MKAKQVGFCRTQWYDSACPMTNAAFAFLLLVEDSSFTMLVHQACRSKTYSHTSSEGDTSVPCCLTCSNVMIANLFKKHHLLPLQKGNGFWMIA